MKSVFFPPSVAGGADGEGHSTVRDARDIQNFRNIACLGLTTVQVVVRTTDRPGGPEMQDRASGFQASGVMPAIIRPILFSLSSSVRGNTSMKRPRYMTVITSASVKASLRSPVTSRMPAWVLASSRRRQTSSVAAISRPCVGFSAMMMRGERKNSRPMTSF